MYVMAFLIEINRLGLSFVTGKQRIIQGKYHGL